LGPCSLFVDAMMKICRVYHRPQKNKFVEIDEIER
jgi:hypothetical protein